MTGRVEAATLNSLRAVVDPGKSWRRPSNWNTDTPAMTKTAWTLKAGQIKKDQPGVSREQFIYNLRRASFEKDWGSSYQHPGFESRMLAFVVRLMPKDGSPKTSIPYSDIAALAFTGRDMAAGKSWENWVRKYWEKKAAGEQNIALQPEELE